MKHTIQGTLRKIEYRCSACGKWADRGQCEDHKLAVCRVYESYELDFDNDSSQTTLRSEQFNESD